MEKIYKKHEELLQALQTIRPPILRRQRANSAIHRIVLLGWSFSPIGRTSFIGTYKEEKEEILRAIQGN